MGIREYARHRGCSHVAVLKAIDTGRLERSIYLVAGKKKINPLLADQEWFQESICSSSSINENFDDLEGLIAEVMALDVDKLLK